MLNIFFKDGVGNLQIFIKGRVVGVSSVCINNLEWVPFMNLLHYMGSFKFAFEFLSYPFYVAKYYFISQNILNFIQVGQVSDVESVNSKCVHVVELLIVD